MAKIQKKSSEKGKINPIKIEHWKHYWKNLSNQKRGEYPDTI